MWRYGASEQKVEWTGWVDAVLKTVFLLLPLRQACPVSALNLHLNCFILAKIEKQKFMLYSADNMQIFVSYVYCCCFSTCLPLSHIITFFL